MTSTALKPLLCASHSSLHGSIERNDSLRVENDGTLTVQCEEIFESGSSQVTTVQVLSDDSVSIEVRVIPSYLSDMPTRHATGKQRYESLARHIRTLAMPLLATPGEGMVMGVDLIVGVVFQSVPLKPMITLVG